MLQRLILTGCALHDDTAAALFCAPLCAPLRALHVAVNRLSTLAPLAGLTQLHELTVSHNPLAALWPLPPQLHTLRAHYVATLAGSPPPPPAAWLALRRLELDEARLSAAALDSLSRAVLAVRTVICSRCCVFVLRLTRR